MIPLAKLWTFVGNWFIPLAAGWAVFVRGGLTETAAPGVRVSRAYWGLGFSLFTAAVLIAVFALYLRAARQRKDEPLVPPNTKFESSTDRSPLISWGTLIAYALCVAAAFTVFGTTYSESLIYEWDKKEPLADGFWSSRAAVHRVACDKSSCFAMGPRFDEHGDSVAGVNQYLPFVSDGALLVLLLCLALSTAYVMFLILSKPSAARGAHGTAATGGKLAKRRESL
jgi:hypothetical protein